MQTGVEVSGVPVMSYVVFPANSVAGVVELIDEFTIFDDETALELDEEYQIFLVNASIDENVVLGSPANIIVMDDDCEYQCSYYAYDSMHKLLLLYCMLCMKGYMYHLNPYFNCI